MADAAVCSLAVAGIPIELRCGDGALAGLLRERYADFPAAGPPRLAATISLAGAARELPTLDQGISFAGGVARCAAPGYAGWIDAAAGEAGLDLSSRYPAEDCDYFVRMIYALLLFDAGGLLFHAAGLERGGRGYVFWGHSGSGKTTVARVSRGARVLNDDLVALLPVAGRWQVHATPFWNPSQVRPAGAASSPLAALCRLVQAPAVALEPMSPGQAVAEISASAPVISLDPGRLPTLLGRARRLAAEAPVWRLLFLPDDSFWPLLEARAAAGF
ncbi:MAG TPA: hypothetical protein VGE07_14440 [Herpetosiphonaceae bacterium]